MSDDTMARIQLIQFEARRLRSESQTCTDLERLKSITNEMQVLYNSILDIRRQQIMDSMPEPKERGRGWVRWWWKKP